MSRLVYSTLLYLLSPVILIRLLIRSRLSPAYRYRISERFALNEVNKEEIATTAKIWVHAVSVGEVMAAQPMVLGLLAKDYSMLVTTTTPTGSQRVTSLFGDTVSHQYLPYDLPDAVARFLKKQQPSLLVIMETELWPNIIQGCAKTDVKILLANARMSEKSAKGYARFSPLTRPMLQKINLIAAQSDEDAKRLMALGAQASAVSITGNLKNHLGTATQNKEADSFFKSVLTSSRELWIAASTREGEETKLLKAHKLLIEKIPTLILLIVPRHPERFDSVFNLAKEAGFNTVRRTCDSDLSDKHQVIIGDSMGEMPNYYSLASVAFVGGSLVDTGCQNVLEPASASLPVVVGPSQFNFASSCQELEEAGGLVTVNNEKQLAVQVESWFENPETATQAGKRGYAVVSKNQQSLPAVLALVNKLLDE